MTYYDDMTQRNIGILTKDEQDILSKSTIAIIGTGGDGGLLAERLTRLGVGNIRLCDPEVFSIENANRQFACDSSTIGINKAMAVGNVLKLINPNLNLTVLTEGINDRNIDSFIDGTNLIIDESEYSLPQLAVMIGRRAKAHNVSILTGANVGLGANIFAFNPDGMTVDQYYGFSSDTPLDVIAQSELPIMVLCPSIPSYIALKIFSDVASGKISVPTISQSVATVAAVVANEACEFLIGRRDLIYVPYYIHVDLHHRTMKIKKASKIGFYSSLLGAYIRLFTRTV